MTLSPLRCCGVVLLACLLTPIAAVAQGPPPARVGYTEARQHAMRQALDVTGTVEARNSSVVASEVAGLVEELAVREGDVVRRGQPIVRLRRQAVELQLQSMGAQLREAQARLALADRSLERARELHEEQVISRHALDDAISEQSAWEGRVASLEAELARVQDELDRSAVTAPFAGVVVREHVQVGEWLERGGAVVEIVSLDELEVVLDVPERQFGSLEIGAEAAVTFEALPGVRLSGRVVVVIPRADPQARTFPVRVRIDDAGTRVGVGMLARVALPVGEARPVTVVPKDAVVRQGGTDVVFRLGGEAVEMVPVRAGTAAGEWIEVAGELRPGEAVVTRGNERLRPGQRVEGEPVEYEAP